MNRPKRHNLSCWSPFQSGHLLFKPSIIMVRLSELDKARAIGQIEAGVPQRQVAATFGVSESMISKLKVKFRETGDVKDRPRTGRPRKTTVQEDRFITVSALRNRRLPATHLQARHARRYGRRVSVQTIRNRLHEANLRARKPAKKPRMTALICFTGIKHGKFGTFGPRPPCK